MGAWIILALMTVMVFKVLYECDLDYDTHPYEIEAEYEEEKWEKYKLNTIVFG